MEKIIIDGYNLIYKIREFDGIKQLKNAREALIELISGYVSGKKIEAIIVFDGRSGLDFPVRTAKNVRVLFSASPQKADELITDIVSYEPNPKSVKVVSSDAKIKRFSASMRAKTIPVETFLKMLYKKKYPAQENDSEKKPYIFSSEEIKYWLKVFSAKKLSLLCSAGLYLEFMRKLV